MGNKYQYSVNSFSYYQSLQETGFHIFDYIEESRSLECSMLNPWFGHFTKINQKDDELTEEEISYLDDVLDCARQSGLPFELITIDGDTYVYDEDEEVRKRNKRNAKKWITIGSLLGAKGVRFDASLPEDTTPLTEEVLNIISDGYRELIEYGKQKGIKIYIENHYGITSLPDDMLMILDQVPDLYYLFDSWNWHHKKVAEAWVKCLERADDIHIKTFYIKDGKEDILVNLSSLLNLMEQSEFKGCYTIETMPLGLEYERALIKDTLKLIQTYKEKSNE